MKTWQKFSLCVIVLLLMFWKIQPISSRLISAKNFLQTQYRLWKINRSVPGYHDLPPLSDNVNEWYAKYHFIAHNGGIIAGRLKSDSLEAWQESYFRGVRIIDADLSFTSDKHLVLRHSWRDDLEQDYYPGQPTHKIFMASRIFQKYTPMDAQDMVKFMLSHPDLYAACDSKYDPAEIFSALAETAKSMNAEEVLSRIIVSLYRTEDVDRVKAVYPFKNFALRQYGLAHNWYSLADFCVKNNIHAVNVWHTVIDDDPEGVKLLVSKGIHIFAAVVNSLKQLQGYKALGVTGAVSDYLSESDWELIR